MEKSIYITLNNGHKMARIGLGTLQLMKKDIIYNAIVKNGYRNIDTAHLYGNEDVIGDALVDVFKSTDIKREDLFIITKMWPSQFDDPKKAIQQALKRLKLEQVDLFVIHWPANYWNTKTPMHILWKNMEDLVDSGLTKSIGVSNFNLQLIADMMTYCRIKPVCNEIEIHPFCVQEELVRFLIDQEIAPIAYYPLHKSVVTDFQNDKVIQQMSKKYRKTVYQIILRWGIDRNYCIIPRSQSEKHQKENIDIFDFNLTEEEIQYISKKNRNERFCNKWGFFGGYDLFA